MLHPSKGVRPYCEWDERKKERVYDKLTNLIRTRADQGFAYVVTKKDYDECVPGEMRRFFGKDHYVWAIKVMMIEIEHWRKKFHRTRPMQYIFSNLPKGKGTKGEIMEIFDSQDEDPKKMEERYGIVADGYGFQNMRLFPPLQAADILAWNMLDHYGSVIAKGLDDVRDVSTWFRPLRAGRPMHLQFVAREDMQRFTEMIMEHKRRYGRYPSKKVERLLLKEQRRVAREAEKRIRELRSNDESLDKGAPQRDQSKNGPGEKTEKAEG